MANNELFIKRGGDILFYCRALFFQPRVRHFETWSLCHVTWPPSPCYSASQRKISQGIATTNGPSWIVQRLPQQSKMTDGGHVIFRRKSRFFHTPFYITTPRKTVANIFPLFSFTTKPDSWPDKWWKVFCRLTTHARHRRTDGKVISVWEAWRSHKRCVTWQHIA